MTAYDTAVESARAPDRKAASSTLLVWALRLVVLTALLASWHYAVAWSYVPEFYVSTPAKTAQFLYGYVSSGEIWIDAYYTVFETVAGLVIGALAGIPSGLLLARFRLADRVVGPFLNGFNAMPRIALAPLFILWFGIGSGSKIILCVSIVYFILLINTQAGARATDADVMMMGRAMGATPYQTYLKIVLPSAVPSIFAGLRLAAVYSLMGAVVGEMLAAQHGWGRQITYFSQTFEVGSVFGLLIILALFSVLLNVIMSAAENRLLQWKS